MRDKKRSGGQSQTSDTVAPPMPSWVKASLVIAALVAVAVVVALLTGGEHGPGRHLGSPELAAPPRTTVAATTQP